MESKLYYTISEVASMIGENPSVLRFWEGEFASLRPRKNSRGVRYYTEQDIALLRRIQHLTRERGYTLEGTRNQLRLHPGEDARQQVSQQLHELRDFLVGLKEAL